MRERLAEFLRWLLGHLAPRATEPPIRCPFCGEERLVERNFCSVCGRTWRMDSAERRHWNRIMGGEL
jgi:hypothetical protein